MIHQDHILRRTGLSDHSDRPMFSTHAGQCTCGKFYVWADTTSELEAAHNHHVAYQQREAEKQQAYQYQQEVNLHTFDMYSSGARCKGCTWNITGIDRSRQREAFSNHIESVRRELNRVRSL